MDILSLIQNYGKYVFVAIYVVYALVKVDKSKPFAWLATHIAVIAAGGFAAASHLNFYLIGGAVVSAVNTVRQLASKQLSFSNPLALGKSLLEDFLAFPVSVFEDAYKAITTQAPVK